MDKIEHVVLLMLENRSFDSLLGWLYQSHAPMLTIPPAVRGDEFRGLATIDRSRFVNSALGGTLSAQPSRGADGFTVPTPDPGEEFEHVNTQFYGTPTPGPGAPVTMSGVLTDFVDVMQALNYSDSEIERSATSIMQCYTPAQLPVLSQLAAHYGVSDAWFASVPSQTNSNRAFLMCGTSHGLVDNGELEPAGSPAKAIEKLVGIRIGDDRFPDPTLFNALHDAGRDWKLFWQTSYLPQKISKLLDAADDIPIPALKVLLLALRSYSDYLKGLSSGEPSSGYTWRLFPAIQEIPDAAQHFATLDDFHALARGGALPAFSYIEPLWTISQTGVDTGFKRVFTAIGNDYHPPSNLLVGEEFLRGVYESLIADRDAWARTVLIITFDEFVGSFDHATPPAAVPPWGEAGQAPFHSPTGFRFDRLGARVPTVIVSPYVRKSSVFRSTSGIDYDHTSIIATTLQWLGLGDQRGWFGQRTMQAPTFDNVLVLDEARTDERDLEFLQTARRVGDPVGYGDLFSLQCDNGSYIASFEVAAKAGAIPDNILAFGVDIGLAANFPTLGEEARKAPLVFLCPNPDPGVVADGDQVWLVSKEMGLVADNVLGAWGDAYDCYYYDLYVDGDNADKQIWTVHDLDHPGSSLRYGDGLRLDNASYKQGLCRDSRPFEGKWITTSTGGSVWRILPFATAVAGQH